MLDYQCSRILGWKPAKKFFDAENLGTFFSEKGFFLKNFSKNRKKRKNWEERKKFIRDWAKKFWQKN